MSDTPTSGTLSESDDRQWASFAHLGGILGPLPALIIWLVFKDKGSFTDTEGKEALNFQITVVIATIVLSIVGTALFVLVLPLLFPYVPWVLSVVFSIIGFTKAKEGENYRYPFALRLIK